MFSKVVFSLVFILLLCSGVVFAHCQIPCGIYDDQMRIKMISEDIDTIAKSIENITKLSQEKTVDYNQLVRWVNNKEFHADHIQEVVSEYFMYQRLKPVPPDESPAYENYIEQLRLLHQLGIYSMKAKQSLDIANVEKLRGLLDEFNKSYFEINP